MADNHIGTVVCRINENDHLSLYGPDGDGEFYFGPTDHVVYLDRNGIIDLMAILHKALSMGD